MLLQGTYFETGFTNDEHFTAVMVLGCGIVVVHDAETIERCIEIGYKLHNVFGRKVGFALFTKQV
jgi:hypothetical protein